MRISELREQKGITQKQLADAIGVKNYIVGNWEQGRTNPDVEDLVAMANYFKCSVDYLIGREDDFGNIILSEQLSSEQRQTLGLYSALPQSCRALVLQLMYELQRKE